MDLAGVGRGTRIISIFLDLSKGVDFLVSLFMPLNMNFDLKKNAI
jgi:hypothetical protein